MTSGGIRATHCQGQCPRRARKHFVNTRARGTPPSAWMNSRARTRIDARQLQRGVRLDRRREVARPVEPDRPRAVVALPREQLVRDLAVEVGRAKPEEVMPEQVLRDHRRVRLELAYPPAVRVLELEQAGRGTVDGRVQRRPDSVRRDCQTATLIVTP